MISDTSALQNLTKLAVDSIILHFAISFLVDTLNKVFKDVHV